MLQTSIEISKGWQEIDQDTVLANMDKDVVELVDMREKELYSEGHISGAINIPYDEFKQRTTELNSNQSIILICHTGRMGIESVDYLVEQGFQDVFNFGGGMEEWNGPLN